jgi:GNAT superfamily N-acetyltransferase
MPPLFAQWLQVLAGRPKWTLVAAFDQAQIVGGGLLFIDNRVAWLGMGGIVPEARGRHAHRAIMTRRIDIAIERGCTHIVTETGEPINNEPNPSLRNMYRCGFTRASSRMNYAMGGK